MNKHKNVYKFEDIDTDDHYDIVTKTKYEFGTGVVSPETNYRKQRKKREADVRISKDSPPLNQKAVPTLTPNLRQTGTTLHTSNYMGMTESYNRRRDVFSSPIESDDSSQLYKRHHGILSRNVNEYNDLDDSLNNRASPEKNLESSDFYKTPIPISRESKVSCLKYNF